MPNGPSSIFFINQFSPPAVFSKSTDIKRTSTQPKGKPSVQTGQKITESALHLENTLSTTSLNNLGKGVSGPDVFNTERYLWLTLIWFIYSLTVLTILNLIYKWLTAEARFTIESSPVNVYELPFPALTICSTNQFRPSAVNLTKLHQKIVSRETLTLNEKKLLDLANNVCFKGNGAEEAFIDEKIINLMIQKVGQKCSDVIQGIWWRDESVKNVCDYFLSVFTTFGLCFTFNSLPLHALYSPQSLPLVMNQQKLGNLGSRLNNNITWSLEEGYRTDSLKWADTTPLRTVGDEKKPPYWSLLSLDPQDHDDSCFAGFRGYHISVHSPTETASSPGHNWYPLTHRAINRLKLKIHLKRTSESMRHWSVQKRGCFYDYERSLFYFSIYSEKNCFAECLSNRSFIICNCVPLHLPRTKDMAVCGSLSIGCAFDAFDAIIHKEEFKSTCNCLPSCTEIKYEVFGNVLPLNPNKFVVEQFKKRENLNISIERLSAVTGFDLIISSKQLYPLTRAPVFPLHSFIGKVGGTLSLMMGCSVASFLEIVFFLSSRFISNQNNNKLKKKVIPFKNGQD